MYNKLQSSVFHSMYTPDTLNISQSPNGQALSRMIPTAWNVLQLNSVNAYLGIYCVPDSVLGPRKQQYKTKILLSISSESSSKGDRHINK